MLPLLATYLELAKARLTVMVLATTAVGFVLSDAGPIDWQVLICTLLGTAMAGAGANGLNQCLEARSDARMPRTHDRPLPAHRISRQHALIWSVCTAMVGASLLAATVNILTAALSAAAVLLYVLAYTPLKQRNPVCTLIGAVVGALPPMMGWTAATNSIGAGAWIMGAILFTWQIPHSLALAWLYRQDYARGGFHILTWNDSTGSRTFHMIVLYCLCLLPVSAALYLAGLTGPWYALAAVCLGTWLLLLAVRLQRSGLDAHARSLFVATVIYLPLLLGFMVVDRCR